MERRLVRVSVAYQPARSPDKSTFMSAVAQRGFPVCLSFLFSIAGSMLMNKKQCRLFVGRSASHFLAQTIAALLSLGSMLTMMPARAVGEPIDAVTPDVTYSINPGQYITFSFKWVCNGGLSGPYNEPVTGTPYMSGQLSPYNGLTASLSPNPGTSNVDMESLTITAANNAVAGTYPIVVDGVGNPAGPCPTYTYPQFPQTLTLVVNGAQLKINLLPQPPAQNQYVINATPKMPTIQASAQVVGISPDPTPQTTFTWTANLSVNENVLKNGKVVGTKKVAYDSYLTQNAQTTGTATFTLTTVNPNDIVGGNLTLNVSAVVNGNTLTASTPAGLSIVGTNPAQSSAQGSIASNASALTFDGLGTADVIDALDRIACHETIQYGGQTQFAANANGGIGPVILSFDNGVGMFQLTNPDPFKDPNNLYNWPINVKQGVKLFKQKIPPAKGYPAKLNRKSAYTVTELAAINQVRAAANLSPIATAPAPSFTTAGVVGLANPDQLLEDSVRGFNGYGNIRLYSLPLHEFQPDVNFLETVPNAQLATLATNPLVWMRTLADTRGSKGDQTYVGDVISQSPTTCGGS